MRNPGRGHARFGAFDIDLDAGELRKHGIRIGLQKQPLEVLALLIEHPGDLVTREEIRDRIWGPNTYGDFDQNLNKAIRKIRTALDDSADEPQYVETLPTRGYRFLQPVTRDPAGPANGGERQQPSDAAPVPSPPHAEMPSSKPRRWLAPVLAGVLASGALVAWILTRPEPATPRELIQRQLTTNSAENVVESAILSPDGKYLLFGDRLGIHTRLIATGETHTFKRPAELAGVPWYPAAWFPDGAHFIAVSRKPTPQGERVTSWLVTLLGGATTLLRDNADTQAVSPDGSLIAFTAGGSDLWVMGPRGEDARRVLTGGDFNSYYSVRWSPQGRRLVYSRNQAGEYSIESCDLKGEAVTVTVPHLAGDAGLGWLPDGRIIYSVTEGGIHSESTNLWEIRADPATGRARGHARRITNWLGVHTDRFSFSADGKRMVVQKSLEPAHALIARLQADGRLETPRRLTLEDSYELPLAWTPDNKVLFLSDRTGMWKLYKQALDQPQAEPLTTGPDEDSFARLSPDGRWALYNLRAGADARFARLMRLPLSGGPPEFIMQTTPQTQFNCSVSPATECVLTEWSEGVKETIVTTFDPLTGSRHKLFQTVTSEHGQCCTLSPDGSEFAVFISDPRDSRIRILSHSGEFKKDIRIRGWTYLCNGDWATDGQSLFTSSCTAAGCTLLRVYRSGRVEPVWKSTLAPWGIQSRDGRYLALLEHSAYSNAWLLENF